MSASSAIAEATTASIGETTQQQRGTRAFSNAYIGSPHSASVPLPKVESPESEEDAEPVARHKVAESPAEAAAAAASQEQLETELTDMMKAIHDVKTENEATAAKIKKLEANAQPPDAWDEGWQQYKSQQQQSQPSGGEGARAGGNAIAAAATAALPHGFS